MSVNYQFSPDEFPEQAPAFVPEDEAADPSWAPSCVSTCAAALVAITMLAGADEALAFPSTGSPGHSEAITLTTRLPRPVVFTDDEELPVTATVVVDDEAGWSSGAWPIPPPPAVFDSDDAFLPVAQLLLATFTASDGTSLDAYQPEIGERGVEAVGDWWIQSGTAQVQTQVGNDIAVWNVSIADVSYEVDLTFPNETFSVGLVFNYLNNNNYWLLWFPSTGGTELWLRFGGSFGAGAVASNAYTPAQGSTDRYRIVTSGDRVLIYGDGNLLIDYSTGGRSLQANTKLGLWQQTSFGTPLFDNINVYLSFGLEDEAGWTAEVTRQALAPVEFSDDESLAISAATFGLDEDAYDSPQQAVPWVATTFTDEDAGAELKNFYLEQEEPWEPLRQAIPWTPFAFTDNDTLGQAPSDSTGPPAHSAVITLTTRAPLGVVFEDDEALAIASTPFGLEEYEYQSDTIACGWTVEVFLSDEEQEPVIEEVYEWVAQVQSTPWQAVAFNDDEALPIEAVPFYLEQEEPWTAEFTRQAWTPLVFSDDEVLAIAAVQFGLEQEEPWTALCQTTQWTPVVFSDDDQFVATLGFDDDPPTWIFDQRQFIPACPMTAATDDELWVEPPSGLLPGPWRYVAIGSHQPGSAASGTHQPGAATMGTHQPGSAATGEL